jgi:hypothetical protein
VTRCHIHFGPLQSLSKMANHWDECSEEEMYENNVGHRRKEPLIENLFMQQTSSNIFGQQRNIRSEQVPENLSNRQMFDSNVRNQIYNGSEQFSENLLDQRTYPGIFVNQMHVGGSDHFPEEMFSQQISNTVAGNTTYVESEHLSETLQDGQASGYTLGNQMHVESERFNEDMFNQPTSGHMNGGSETLSEGVFFNQPVINYFATNRIAEFEHFPEEIEARFSRMWKEVATFQQNMLLEQSHQDFFANSTCWSTMDPIERRKEGLRAVVDTIVDQTKLLVEVSKYFYLCFRLNGHK